MKQTRFRYDTWRHSEKISEISLNTIPKNANVLAKVNELPYGSLLNMPSHDVYSIPIHLCTMILADISPNKRVQSQ